jgi:putative transposase
VIFRFIDEHRECFPVRVLCEVLGVSPSGYYARRTRPPSARARRRRELAAEIRRVHLEHRRVYGSPRVHRVLRERGHAVCRNTVARLMKSLGIAARSRRRFRARTTDADHPHPVAANTLDRRFGVERLDRVWASDITYIPTGEGFLYLAGVMDLCSRRIVGWSMGATLHASLACAAFTMAVRRRRPPRGLLHHSDRGVQYACDEYRRLLASHGVAVSMSRPGDCYDNAALESFWGTLKTELVHHERFATRDQARRAIFEYIEVFYNRRRLHSTLGYLSPEQFEARQR